ncbi:hypothetical protein [Natronoglycomyces albus]|uniref:Uncharacterized protein n=1 Tax=Natronoglycomyces albus TaxID=2811108 RepID=A0A895XXA2_9ACTN|nr:hypothetical protein [Natronoglycomyces albus]QSB07146.1 hypothetical protein JQS30_17030 [Natronoglycomyces albus]
MSTNVYAEWSDRLTAADDAVETAKRRRDQVITDAVAAGMPQTRIADALGIKNRMRINALVRNEPPEPVYMDELMDAATAADERAADSQLPAHVHMHLDLGEDRLDSTLEQWKDLVRVFDVAIPRAERHDLGIPCPLGVFAAVTLLGLSHDLGAIHTELPEPTSVHFDHRLADRRNAVWERGLALTRTLPALLTSMGRITY